MGAHSGDAIGDDPHAGPAVQIAPRRLACSHSRALGASVGRELSLVAATFVVTIRAD